MMIVAALYFVNQLNPFGTMQYFQLQVLYAEPHKMTLPGTRFGTSI